MSPGSQPRSAASPEYAELVDILTRGGAGGAIVLGGPGMGKTSLVQAAMARPGIAPPVLRLHCSTTLTSVPYGALSPYLSSLERVEDPVQVLREISTIVGNARTEKTPPTVLVEDAQFLDPESSFVLSMLVENSAIKLIAIGAGRIDGESTLFSLTDSGLLSTIVVQPLEVEGIRRLAQALTGGRLTEGTLQVIRSMTGGNASLVRAFVQSCLSQGVLVRDEGSAAGELWVLARLSPETDDALVEVVRDIHSFLPERQQRILELLALGGPQSRALLVACEGSDYRHLLESGVLTVQRDGMIRFGAEIHGLVLRHLVAPGRSAKLHAVWDTHRRELQPDLNPEQVLWSLEVRAEVPSAEVLEAVETANDELDYPLAWKLCSISGVGTASDRGALAECRTLLGLGRFYSARAKLGQLTRSTADTLIGQRALTMLRLALIRQGGDDTETVHLPEQWRAGTRELENRAEFTLIQEEYARTTEVVELWRAAQEARSGESLRAQAERILDQPRLSSENRTVALLVLSDLYSVEGKTDTALGFARQAMAELDQNAALNGNYQLHVLLRIGWNLVFSGRYAEAEEFVSQRAGSTVRTLLHRRGTLSLIRGIAQLLKGQTEQARITLAEVKAEFRLREPSRVVLAEMFQELARDRRLTGAQFGAEQRQPPGPSGAMGQDPAEADVSRRMLYRAVAAGLGGPGHETLEDFPLIAREVLFLAEERLQADPEPEADLNAQLAGLVLEMEGTRAQLLGRLAAAHGGSGSAEDLRDLACDATQAQEYHVAVEAMAKSANLYVEVGDNRNCGMVLRELTQLLRSHQVTAGPYAVRALAMAELTTREEEIVELARGGRNNAEIARILTVSQRTVEGHLYRVFAKLGINDRSELTGLPLLAGTSRD